MLVLESIHEIYLLYLYLSKIFFFLFFPVNPGLHVFTPPPLPRFLASFHGDTNGLQSVPLLKAVHASAAAESASLLLGLDANVHEVCAMLTHATVDPSTHMFVSLSLWLLKCRKSYCS